MPYLEVSPAPSIVATTSVSGRESDFTGYAYGAYKAALVHYMNTLAVNLAPKGIRANAVSPGNTYFDGGIWQRIKTGNPDLYAHALALNPTGRMARPDEIARSVVFLSSPASSFTTGAHLVVDGALTRGIQLLPGDHPGSWHESDARAVDISDPRQRAAGLKDPPLLAIRRHRIGRSGAGHGRWRGCRRDIPAGGPAP